VPAIQLSGGIHRMVQNLVWATPRERGRDGDESLHHILLRSVPRFSVV